MTIYFVEIVTLVWAITATRIAYHWRPAKAALPQNSREGLNYGHPRKPVSYLKERLPAEPPGTAWEIKVTVDKHGAYWMELGLLDVAKDEYVANREIRSLTHRQYGDTWSAWYEKYSIISMDEFKSALIRPYLNYAEALANKITSAGDVKEYDI